MFDKDGDGDIDIPEFVNTLKSLGQNPSQKEIDDRWVMCLYNDSASSSRGYNWWDTGLSLLQVGWLDREKRTVEK